MKSSIAASCGGRIAPQSGRRRGVSLVELLAAMTAASVVMATSMGLVHRSFSFESRSRGILADERTALRLARQFRTDVHEAVTVTGGPDDAPGGVLVAIGCPDRRITYRREPQGLVRRTELTTGVATREHYPFSKPVEWAAQAEGRLVSLTGTTAVAAAGQPSLALEAVAMLPLPREVGHD